ncbi:MAG TPA: hypothetical protein VMB24_06095 [Dehalococcoidales bacterium]|nr:hypothetical protein [Dehalococcoidales bacterium]
MSITNFLKISASLISLLLVMTSCGTLPTAPTGPAPTSLSPGMAQATLYVADYGYKYGDIVQLDTKTSPKLGDVVLYSWALNKSNFMAFGPDYQLIKIVGMPGDSVTFAVYSYKVNSYNIGLRDDVSYTANVMWGTTLYPSVAGLTLKVPDGEYLADRWVGQEGKQGGFGKSQSVSYNRFTVKKEAVSGVVVKKIGSTSIPPMAY